MPDTELQNLTTLSGAPLHSDVLYLCDDPAISAFSRKVTVANLLQGGAYGHNVLHYGALGNSHYYDGGGADDTVAIQAAYDAAAAAGGYAAVIFPGRRTYRVTSSINVPQAVRTIGIGGRDSSGSETPPNIAWDGNTTTGPFLVSVATNNIGHTSFENIAIIGVTSITNKPAWGVKFQTSGASAAKLDTGTYFREVVIQNINGPGVWVGGYGATNFYWQGGRWDGCTFCVYVNLPNGAEFIAQFLTTTCAQPASGFLHLDAEGVTAYAGSFVTIVGLHMELNNATMTETFSAGTNPCDKHGMIRLGVKPSLEVLQHRIDCHGLTHAAPSDATSHSIFHITATSGTDAAASDCVSVSVNNGNNLNGTAASGDDTATTGEIRLFGGKVPAGRRFPSKTVRRIGNIVWGFGPLNASEVLISQIHTRYGQYTTRGLGIRPEVFADLDAFGAPGALAYVTDAFVGTIGNTVAGGGSTKVLVMFNGSAWKIIAAV